MKTFINIKEIEQYYSVTEHGEVYSLIKDRWLKPRQNSCGYIYYFLQYPYKRWIFAHTLVCLKYHGFPGLKFDVDHIDNNKANNHYTNLRWITHQENILRSYREFGRVCYWKDKHKPSPELETRIKMANAKLKPVKVLRYNKEYKAFNSVANLCEFFKIHRKTFNRAMLKEGAYKQYIFQFETEKPV